MLEILRYDFFQYAIIWWVLISLISSIFGVFIVMRKEANITHSIWNLLFLWIAVSLVLNSNYYIFAFIFWIIWSFFIYLIEKSRFITKESTKEIISQVWMAWALFVIWFMDKLSLDINNLLFWSILFINKLDLIILFVLLIIVSVLFFYFWKNFIAMIINEDIAKSMWINVWIYKLIFLVLLSIFIAIAIKIFGILLVWAFLVIPTNTAKILSNSLKNVFIFSAIFSVLWVIFWLFASYFLWTWSGATIVLVLILFFVFSLLIKKCLSK